jgi:hypothetical protein
VLHILAEVIVLRPRKEVIPRDWEGVSWKEERQKENLRESG